ncbi:GNAT family N-acetyltransferase [Nonomuraea sp. NPDC059023]|uniref:GNAT family N-acetyltransferase n=1 Tax=unclassified Nonomuraea TaxID=2593643 RepID=UPI0036C86DD5
MNARVRPAVPADLPRVAELATEHTAYEKAPPPPPDLAGRLSALLFGAAVPRLRCLVAETPSGEVVGYATCAAEVSTWAGSEYLHMDCLFLNEASRGHGLGRLLMAAVVELARELGLPYVQWQTPVWNEGAIRFYDRLGARSLEKHRYTLDV